MSQGKNTTRRFALQLYRLAVLVAAAWLLRSHHIRMRIEGDAPLTVVEMRAFFPKAEKLRLDPGARRGAFVEDATGQQLGYVVRTMPDVEKIIGYRGWTDALIALDPGLRVVGVAVRSSQDTKDHVGDMVGDRHFLKTWNGKPWSEVARQTPEEQGIEGVSGATLTSMAVAEGIQRRLASSEAELAIPAPGWRVRARDVGLALVTVCGCVLVFVGTHGRAWLRRSFQALVIGYVGLLNGDLLAQSLFVGWAQNGAVPWMVAPGLVLLAALALAVPWTTGKPLYCQQLCPHGAAQEWIARAAPRRWRLRLPRGVDAGLRWLPGLTIGFVLAVVIPGLPLDLAGVEPFDAYSWKTAGVATLVVAGLGLLAACFIPMAYCHYGCPTGAVLNFMRSHGSADRFGGRDWAALALLGWAWALIAGWPWIHGWLVFIE